MSFPFNSKPNGYLTAALLTGATLLAGCGGGDTSTGPGANDQTELVVSLTDADGDFVSYTVDVKSLELTHANGAVIETVPQSTRVDFAQYQELTEFLTAATVPPGRYRHAVATVDFSNAQILVERNGQAVPATPVDASGQPLGVTALTIDLDPNRPFIIAPGIPAHLTVDFDLAVSNQVDLSTEPPTVTVEPVLVADLNPEQPKPHRLRGLLREVSVPAQQFSLAMRPFWIGSGGFGVMTVHTDAQTEFEIDGANYTGTIGLEQLATMPIGSPSIAFGKIRLPSRQFVASEVYAGNSVLADGLDLVHGTIIARNDMTLTVRGATLARQDGAIILNDTMTITIGSNTRVTKQGSRDPVSIADISVGQRITLAGAVTSESTTGITIDASAGWLRLNFSDVAGFVTTQAASELVVNAQRINGRNTGLYDFSGTGSSPDNDADPAAYQINTSDLAITDILPNDPVVVRGFPTAFGAAPADFTAKSIINLADTNAALVMTWVPPSNTAIAEMQASQWTLNLDTTVRHHVVRHGLATDLTAAGNSVTLAFGNNGIFVLKDGATRRVYFDVTSLSDAIARRINEGALVAALRSVGRFTDSSSIFQARRLVIELQ